MAREPGLRLFFGLTSGIAAVAVSLVYLFSLLPSPPASSQPRPAAARLPSRFSDRAKLRRSQVFAQVQGDQAFKRLGEPIPGEWLWHFREPGQTLEEYGGGVVNRKGGARTRLHLQPFTDLSAVQRRVVEPIRQHIAIFFDSETVLLPARQPRASWLDRRRDQYDADQIVDQLSGAVPASSLGLFGLMGSDLHALRLNFVFGVALLQRRAGIYSVHRFGQEPGMLLRRALKLSAHEIGHIFGLKHCVFYECVMNGTNSLAETDRRPLHACPVCLAKLQWNLRFDPARRQRALAAFYRQHGLHEEAGFAEARAGESSATSTRP